MTDVRPLALDHCSFDALDCLRFGGDEAVAPTAADDGSATAVVVPAKR
jgi:hypothetical protein